MTKKSKKLGVKISKQTVADESFEVNSDVNDKIPQDSPNEKSEQFTDSDELNQVCTTLDNLTLDMLILMEQQIQQKLCIEQSMTEGELHLAKSRYIMGQKSVSTLQLPTDNCVEIDPIVTVEEILNDERMFDKPCLKLNMENASIPISNDLNKDTGETDTKIEKNCQDPIKWFGLLVPRDLRSAQAKFKSALNWIVECANTQTRLQQTYIKILQLSELKNKLKETNTE